MDGLEWNPPPSSDSSDSDSSSEDWEESMDTSELDFPSTDSDSDDEDFVSPVLPTLSRYLTTC